MGDLVTIDRKQLEAANSRIKELEAQLAATEYAPSTNEEWLLQTRPFESRSITNKSTSTVLPWVVLIIGLMLAYGIFKVTA